MNMKFENYKYSYYEAPKLEEFKMVYTNTLTTLSIDGYFDESAFDAEEDSVFGWGNEGGVN